MGFTLLGILSSAASGGASPYFLGVLSDPLINNVRTAIGLSTGDFYLSGLSRSADNIYYPFLAKLDATGSITWESKMTVGTDVHRGKLNSSGDIVIGGRFEANQGYAKWQPNGTFVHYVKGGFSNVSVATALDIDSSDNVYVGGYDSDGRYGAVIKLNSSGTIVWTKGVAANPYPDWNRGKALIVNSSSEVFFLIRQDSGGGNQLVKLNSSGTLNTSRGFSINGWNDMRFDSSGNIYLVGENSGGHLMKLNSSLSIVSQTKLGTAATTSFLKMFIDSSDNIYVTGLISGGTILAKYDTSLNLVWQRKISTANAPGEISVNGDGDLFISGSLVISGNTEGFYGYLPSNGSVTGSVTLNGQEVIISASSESVSTPTTTLSTPTTYESTPSASYTTYSNTPIDPNFTNYLENV